MYNPNAMPMVVIGAIKYTNDNKTQKGLYITYPRGIHRCLVLNLQFEIFPGFLIVKTEASINALFMSALPATC